MNRRWLAAAVLALLVVACADRVDDSAPASAEAPPLGPHEVAVSDRFWESTSDFSPTEFAYESLAEMAADAHLIVRGRVIGTQDRQAMPVSDPAGELTARAVTFGVVRIIEVLKGSPNVTEPGAVLVNRLGSKNLDVTELPPEDIIIFLMNYRQLAEDFGAGLFDDPSDRFYYTRPNGYQAVLRDINGLVRVVPGPDGWQEALGPFPAPLEGKPFEEVVEAVRQAAAAT